MLFTFALLLLCGAVALVIFLPFWMVARMQRESWNEQEFVRLNDRIETLAANVHALRRRLDGQDVPVPPPAAAVPDSPLPASVPEPLSAVRRDSPPAVLPATPGEIVPPAATVTNRPGRTDAPPPAAVSTLPQAPAHDAGFPHPGRMAPHAPATAAAPHHSSSELEARLGTNWLNKLGALLLVVGIAFFMTYQLRTLGPLGKDIVGFLAGAALLAGGVVAERRTDYRMFSRGVMAAGWALVFFTTFAMYHVPAARVLDSQAVDLALMLVVAGGMIAHALRYRSESVTGLAFLLAFATVAISHDAAFTLPAAAILAAASAAIAVRMRWFGLEIGAIAATYANHLLWSAQLPASPLGQALPHFDTSLALVLLYWAIFRIAYLVRRNIPPDGERTTSLGAVLNSGAVILVSTRYLANPDLVFTLLVALGVAEAVGAWLVRGRRPAFATLMTMGVVLVAAAFPVRFGPRTVALVWFLEAEALVVIGVRLRDGLFTRLGVSGSALAGVYLYAADVVPLIQTRTGAGPYAADPMVASMLAAAATVYYFNSLRLLRARPEAFPQPFERAVADKLSYGGLLALAGTAWALLPLPWLAPGLMAIGLCLALAARRMLSKDVWVQSQLTAFTGVMLLIAVNFQDAVMVGPLHRRLVVVLLGAAAQHSLYRVSRLDAIEESDGFGALHAWIGSALLAALLWYELEPLAVVLAWSALAVLALEAGVHWNRRDLRLQAFAALAFAFGRVFFVNLNGSGGLLGSAAVSTAPLALVLFYAYERIADRETLRERPWLPEVVAAGGTITLAAMLRVALSPAQVAIGWAALVLLMAAVAARTGRRLFLRQAALGAVAVVVQAVAVNIYEPSYFARWSTGPWFTVVLSALLLLAALPFARRMKLAPDGRRGFAATVALLVSRRPDQALFFAPLLLLVWVSAVYAHGGLVTMAWGAEAVAAFMLALWMRERSFRLGALALLLACVLRITMIDVWRLDQQGRYLAFITLGSALLLVSFLYSKYRGLLEDYL